MAGRIGGETAGHRSCRLSIAAPGRFSLRETVLSHGWHQLSPFRWDATTSILWRGERFPDGALRLLRVSQRGKAGSGLRVHISGRPLGTPERRFLRARMARMLNLDLDLSGFYRVCRKETLLRYVPRRGAGRFLSAGNLYEDVFKAICATNISWNQAVRAVNRIGTLGPSIGESDFRAFPGAEEILAEGPERLSGISRLGYRVPYLLGWAERTMLKDAEYRAAEEGAQDREDFRRFLLSVPGIGPTTCRYLMMLRGAADEIPLDSSVFLYLRENRFHGRTPSRSQVDRLYGRFGEWKAYAYWFEFLPWARRYWGLEHSGRNRRAAP